MGLQQQAISAAARTCGYRLALSAALACEVALAMVAASPVPTLAADLGNCVYPYAVGNPHQGGTDYAVNSETEGVVAVITAHSVNLCDNPHHYNNDPEDDWQSGSTMYTMLANYSDRNSWYQIGWVKSPN